MRILIIGPPGSGKGTQGKIVAEAFKIPHISTGDIFRQAMSKTILQNEKLKTFIHKGQLLPDSLVNTMIFKRIEFSDCIDGYILDGYPRTFSQAEAFDAYLAERHQKLDYVIMLDVPEEIILGRISNRRFCKSCGISFNINTHPSKVENICDYCSEPLLARDDDKEEIILDRIKIYKKETKPLIKFYENKEIMYSIVGDNSIEGTTKEISKCLGRNI